MSRKKTFWLLIGLQVVYVLFIAVWLFVSALSAMGFTDYSVFQSAATWLILAYLISYPLGLLAALVAGWVLYMRNKYTAALLWNLYPMLWILSLGCIALYVVSLGE